MTQLQHMTCAYQVKKLDDITSLNSTISTWFFRLNASAYRDRSHLFGGRYENIYVDEHSLPELTLLINKIRVISADILNVDMQQLKLGFWFNAMSPGHVTSRHNHDDHDEKISGVYYLTVPTDSGNLLLYADKKICIEPQEGQLILFSPTIEHEVSANNSQHTRLSIGFNVGIEAS